MDKLYKPYFLSQLKTRMSAEHPEFKPRKVAKDDPLRWLFSTSSLYFQQLSTGRCVWLNWQPGDGVDREFFVSLGWSFGASVLPHNELGDQRVHSLKEPAPGFMSGLLNVQTVEGRQAIGSYRIATPWEQLYRLSPRAPEAERERVMDKAYAEYLAVPESERIEAVRVALGQAFNSINSVLPRFTSALESLPSSAA